MIVAQAAREIRQHRARPVGVAGGVRLAQPLSHGRLHLVGQLVEDVAGLVCLAAL